MRSVRIGLAPALDDPVRDAVGVGDADPAVESTYLEAVERSGGVAVVLDPANASPLDGVDALMLCGGDFDIPPAWYGETPRARIDAPRERRGRFELELLGAAEARGLPVLGICGGAQLMAVHRGGSLVQDIATLVPDALDHEQGRRGREAVHAVRVAPASALARHAGATELAVNSTHHQSVARPGHDVLAVAWASDGVVEAIEDPARAFWIGVQWHPEKLGEAHADALLRAFVESAAVHRAP